MPGRNRLRRAVFSDAAKNKLPARGVMEGMRSAEQGSERMLGAEHELDDDEVIKAGYVLA